MTSNAAGDISVFNINHGFIEALLRGYRSGFLDDVDYHHLTQCETVEGNMTHDKMHEDM